MANTDNNKQPETIDTNQVEQTNSNIPTAPDAKDNAAEDQEYEVLMPNKWLRRSVNVIHGIVLILSLLLIFFISYDTFKGIPFLTNHKYMTFQLWVCIIFLLSFFFELIVSIDKKAYLKTHWFFFLISIPYLNIISLYDFHLSGQVLFFLRFVPLIRGAYSLAMVMGYISHNRAVSLMTQYLAILLALVYIFSLVFYYEEHGPNPNVKDFWDALYFSAMNTTTVGCYFSAVTPVGKIISVILPTAGMLMLPLFTVYITNRVQAFDQEKKYIERIFARQKTAKRDSDIANN